MECKHNMCFLGEKYPNTSASLACDSECHIKVNESGKIIQNYKKENPKLWDKVVE